jgi:plastocyanin
MNWPILGSLFIALSIMSITFSSLFMIVNVSATVSTESPTEIMQPPVTNTGTASDIFNDKEHILLSNVKNLVVLIPNEGHHGPGEDDEARFIDQSFVPETAVISEGTSVIWFNGDVGHEHDIIVMSNTDSASTSPIYQTGEFTEFEARNYTFNEVGEFRYADTVEYDNGYIMKGNISVTDNNDSDSELLQTVGDYDTLGIIMAPTQDISQHTSDLQNRGFLLDSMHNFQDLRGGQSGTGDEQTLIVWRVPPSMQISTVLSHLSEFSSELPYS